MTLFEKYKIHHTLTMQKCIHRDELNVCSKWNSNIKKVLRTAVNYMERKFYLKSTFYDIYDFLNEHKTVLFSLFHSLLNLYGSDKVQNFKSCFQKYDFKKLQPFHLLLSL